MNQTLQTKTKNINIPPADNPPVMELPGDLMYLKKAPAGEAEAAAEATAAWWAVMPFI